VPRGFSHAVFFRLNGAKGCTVSRQNVLKFIVTGKAYISAAQEKRAKQRLIASATMGQSKFSPFTQQNTISLKPSQVEQLQTAAAQVLDAQSKIAGALSCLQGFDALDLRELRLANNFVGAYYDTIDDLVCQQKGVSRNVCDFKTGGAK
jgi:hypothetical protein